MRKERRSIRAFTWALGKHNTIIILKRKKIPVYHSPFRQDFAIRNIQAIPQNTNHFTGVNIRRPERNLQRNTEMSYKSSGLY